MLYMFNECMNCIDEIQISTKSGAILFTSKLILIFATIFVFKKLKFFLSNVLLIYFILYLNLREREVNYGGSNIKSFRPWSHTITDTFIS